MIAPANSQDASSNPAPQEPRSRRRSVGSLAIGLILGAGLTLVVVVVVLVLANRQTTPALDWRRFEAAQELWEAKAPRDYAMRIAVTGARAGNVEVEVADGKVVRMTRDGWAPSQRRTWEYWSVPGLFDMIRQDLEHAEDPSQPFGVSDPSQVVLRADFDPEYGYPKKYQRAILGGSADLGWEVTGFELRGSHGASPP